MNYCPKMKLRRKAAMLKFLSKIVNIIFRKFSMILT